MMFIEVLANKKSLNMRGLIFGAGINDAEYVVKPFVHGKQVICPFYAKWSSMIERCYSENLHKRQPTYKGCTVCDEWLLFSRFKSWMIKQEWEGKQLDKDILTQGNKIYSPKTCLFVTKEVNGLLTDSKSSRGSYPQGVYYHNGTKNFMARCSSGGKRIYIGYYENPKEAHKAYCNYRYKIISDIAANQAEPLKSALLNYKISEY